MKRQSGTQCIFLNFTDGLKSKVTATCNAKTDSVLTSCRSTPITIGNTITHATRQTQTAPHDRGKGRVRGHGDLGVETPIAMRYMYQRGR